MNENMHIWDQVSRTDPAHTKPVKLGAREFTSIDAMYQIQRATEVFGPVGDGWQYDVVYDTVEANGYMLAIADVTISWGDRLKDARVHYGPVRGCNVLVMPKLDTEGALIDRAQEAMTKSDGSLNTVGLANAIAAIKKAATPRLDEDAFKKAMTDALTKALSHLGFSADVFLGQFDDPNYVRDQQIAANPAHRMAAEYLERLRQAIMNGDELGGLQLIGELRETLDGEPWHAAWSMLGAQERGIVKTWNPGGKGA